MEQVRFSIIVPVYNVEKYIHKCIKSLLCQSFKSYEVLLINDGSTDRCPDICDEYAKSCDFIYAYHKSNGGLSDARNFGLLKAKGEYIIFVDSDDYIEAEALMSINYLIEQSKKVDVLAANCVKVNGNQFHDQVYTLCDSILSGPAFLKFQLMYNTMYVAAWRNIYNKSFLMENHLFFKHGILHEDEHWTPRVFLKARRVIITDYKFYFHQIREGSITQHKSNKRYLDIIKICDDLKNIYEKVEDKVLKELLLDYLVGLYLHACFHGKLLSNKVFIDKTFIRDYAKSDRNKKQARLFTINRYLFFYYIHLRSNYFNRKSLLFLLGVSNLKKNKTFRKLVTLIKIYRKKSKLFLRALRLFYNICEVMIQNPGKQHLIFINIPEHGNLGDQAIVIAEKKLVNEKVSAAMIHEIPQNISLLTSKLLKLFLRKNKVIIHGGGSMGTLWFNNEILFRKIIKLFKKNRIIIFPQTIYYEHTEWGMREFEKSKEIYNNHKDLFIFAREEKSYQIMKEAYYNCQIMLAPDIVTYLNESKPFQDRSGVLMCFRKDKESVLSQYQKKIILETVRNYFNCLSMTDTVINETISAEDREIKLAEKLDEFRKAELVITDRLHGMLFAAITSTPCVALDNCSGKINGVFQWIKHNDYIRFIEDIDNLPTEIEDLMKIERAFYDKRSFDKSWSKIVDLLK